VSLQQPSPKQITTFRQILFRLFRGPSIVVIGGSWKTGKTDFSLRISELLTQYGIVSQVASNIDTLGFYDQLTDAISLKNWLYRSQARKLYIFDEASEHLPNTRGMSGSDFLGLKLFGFGLGAPLCAAVLGPFFGLDLADKRPFFRPPGPGTL